MDADRFDHLSRSLAAPASRRKALGLLGAGGLLATLTGRSRSAAAAPAGTCTLTITGLLSAGTDAQSTVDGTLGITIGDAGAIDTGSLTTTDGSSFDVVGQATGRAISLFVDLGNGTELALLGVGAKAITDCSGTLAGTIAGPQAGDLGSWTATASKSASGSVLGGSSSSGGNSSGNTSGSNTGNTTGNGAGTGNGTGNGDGNGDGNGGGNGNSDCASGVVCGGVCCEGAPGLTPDNITCNAGACECTYSCASAGCNPNGTGTIVNTCGSDPEPHCHSECNVPDDNGCGDMTCDGDQTLDVDTCTCVANDGGCGDTTSDPNNCGACGTVCDSGSCIDSACVETGGANDPCAAEGDTFFTCGGECVDLAQDAFNCGDCGVVCDAGAVCVNGFCI